MRDHMGAYVEQKIDRAKSNGPTHIVGLGKRLGGRTKAQWVTQPLKGGSPYIGEFFVSFLPCGTIAFLDVWRRGGSSRRVRSKRAKEHPSISWISVHLIPIKSTCIIQSHQLHK